MWFWRELWSLITGPRTPTVAEFLSRELNSPVWKEIQRHDLARKRAMDIFLERETGIKITHPDAPPAQKPSDMEGIS